VFEANFQRASGRGRQRNGVFEEYDGVKLNVREHQVSGGSQLLCFLLEFRISALEGLVVYFQLKNTKTVFRGAWLETGPWD